ncbi:hypothetical protein AAUPMB_14580, partial [Pasteurella multocida subsp. multocida str. Anand1_buffalo]
VFFMVIYTFVKDFTSKVKSGDKCGSGKLDE